MNTVYVVGIGPGREDMMTGEAMEALRKADVIIGYTVYLELLGPAFDGKEFRSTPMRKETERCRMCFEEAEKGRTAALVCSGDAGVYGMASLMLELQQEHPDCEVRIIPGITAANSGAALLGAPLNHDYCVISLSDLLTPWETIENRLRMAARGGFAMALYNPSSHRRKDHLRRACDILLEEIAGGTACGYVRNIGREETETTVCSLSELRNAQVDMFTTVFVGNPDTVIRDGKLVTPRGYQL